MHVARRKYKDSTAFAIKNLTFQLYARLLIKISSASAIQRLPITHIEKCYVPLRSLSTTKFPGPWSINAIAIVRHVCESRKKKERKKERRKLDNATELSSIHEVFLLCHFRALDLVGPTATPKTYRRHSSIYLFIMIAHLPNSVMLHISHGSHNFVNISRKSVSHPRLHYDQRDVRCTVCVFAPRN